MPEQTTDQRMIGALLRIPFQATVSRVYEGLLAAGYDDLSPAQLSVFQHMHPQGARLSELAESAQITKQSMGYLVTYLEERGYLERRPDPADGRAKIVCLTRRGQAVEATARKILGELEAEWGQRLGQPRLNDLRALLIDLTAIVEE